MQQQLIGTKLLKSAQSHPWSHRPRLLSVVASTQKQASVQSWNVQVPTVVAVAATVLCISALFNETALPSVKFACTACALGAVAAKLILRDQTAQSASRTAQSHTQRSSSSSGSSTLTSSSSDTVAQILSNPLFAPVAGAAAVAAVLSVLLPSEDLPSVSSLCLLSYVAVTVYKHEKQQEQGQQQQHEQRRRERQDQQEQQQPPAAAAQDSDQGQPDEGEDLDRVQQLEQQLQRQRDIANNYSLKVQQLQRDLKQAGKGNRKKDSLQEQLKQEQGEKQKLLAELMMLQYQLQLVQEELEKYKQAAAAAAAAAAPVVEVQQPNEAPSVSGDAAKPLVAAFVGGKGLKESDKKMIPPGREVRFYGGVKDVGTGDLKRLEAAIKAGSINEVYMLIRWNGHNTTQMVSKLCRDREIPCYTIYPADKVKRKQECADLTSGSDTDSEAWS